MEVKKLLMILMILICFQASATNYYFSNSGNDGNNGLSPATAWASIAKFNSVFASKSPGDFFLFNRGDVFTGTLTISRAGSSGSPITVGAYGSGANPVISGFTTVSSWNNLGGNIWESTTAISTLSTCNMVTINGVNTPMGCFPNNGYLIWQSHGGSGAASTLSSNSLNSSLTNWTGAEVAFFSTTYIVNRFPITAHSATTLTYNATTSVLFQTASSYFIQNFKIQNDVRTLDVQNEWYYNPSTKKIRIYSTSSPTNVKVATVSNLLSWASYNYITVRDIAFEGSNSDAVVQGNLTNSKIVNCSFNFIGGNGVFGATSCSPSNTNIIDSCTLNQVQNLGIDLTGKATITNNSIKNVGMIMGMNSPPGPTTTLSYIGTGIRVVCDGSMVLYNVIDTTGYIGIRHDGEGTAINNNFINHDCYLKGIKDGGGIYTWNGSGRVFTHREVKNNIVLNSGTGSSQGIYCDTKSNGIEISGNTVQGAEWCILLGDQNYNINVHDNTLYDPNSLTSSSSVACLQIDARLNNPSNNFVIKNNIFFARTANQFCLWTLNGGTPTMPLPFTSDSNYFARPIDDNLTIQTYLGVSNTKRNLAMWRTLNGTDANSKKSPVTISNVNQLDFEYNATNAAVVKTLPSGNWVDVKNVSYSGTTTLQPFTSLILISTGAGNILPTANAGSDQTLTWPTNSTTLSGSGSDVDGSIVSYVWSKISGPAPYGITNAGSPTATVNGLDIGVYQFQLMVTDNSGGTATDIVQVTQNKGSGTISVSGTTVPFNNSPQGVTVTTSPAGLSTSTTYNGVTTQPTNAGSYTFITGGTDPHYNFNTVSGTFTITPASASIIAPDITVNFDGLQHTITASTNPAGLTGLTYSYSSGSAPVAIGVYKDTIRLVNANYTATQVIATITIVSNPSIIFISDTSKIYNGSPQGVTVTCAYSYTLTGSPQTNAGAYTVTATINDGIHTGSASATLTIAKQQAILTWGPIANMPYGSLLSGLQLNASANISGTWSYDYPLGTQLPIGTTIITGTFTPTDASNYTGGTVTQTINVYGVNPFLDYFISGNGKFFFIEQ